MRSIPLELQAQVNTIFVLVTLVMELSHNNRNVTNTEVMYYLHDSIFL